MTTVFPITSSDPAPPQTPAPTPPPTPAETQQAEARHEHLQTFYALLGKALALSIVGAAAYQQAKTAGAGSLLQPANLTALIQGVEIALHAAVPD